MVPKQTKLLNESQLHSFCGKVVLCHRYHRMILQALLLLVCLGLQLPMGPEGVIQNSEGLSWLLARRVEHVTLLLLSLIKLNSKLKFSHNKRSRTFESVDPQNLNIRKVNQLLINRRKMFCGRSQKNRSSTRSHQAPFTFFLSSVNLDAVLGNLNYFWMPLPPSVSPCS